MNYINKINQECNFSYITSNNIFDKCILPIILYGCEIWGVTAHRIIESVLLKFCRQQLGVGSNAPAPALLGECGRFNLYVICYIRCIKYWLKIIKMSDNCLLKACYIMLLKQCNAGRRNWVWEIKNLLYRYGFGNIWELHNNNDNVNETKFLKDFGMRVSDCNMQEWHDSILRMPKLRTLTLFKKENCIEPYLLLYVPQRIRRYIAKFRIGVHDLEIERGRHRNVRVNDRICKLCSSIQQIYIEDEYHVLLICPFYNELRNIYLNIEQEPKNLHTFITIMSNTGNELIRLGSFLSNMFKLRKSLLLSMQS